MIFVFVVLILTLNETIAQVHGNIGSQNLLSSGNVDPQLNMYVREALPIPGLSWTGWALISAEWAESYIGFAYSPVSEFEVSVSYGLETNPSPGRLGCGFWIGKYGFSHSSTFEQGGSGFWFEHISKYVFDPVSVGIHYERFKGYGPYMEYCLVSKLVLWGSYLFEEKNNGYLGAKLLF